MPTGIPSKPSLPQLPIGTTPDFPLILPSHAVSMVAPSATFNSSPTKRGRPSPDVSILESPTKRRPSRPPQAAGASTIAPLNFERPRLHEPQPTPIILESTQLTKIVSTTLSAISSAEEANAYVRQTLLNSIQTTLLDLCKNPKYQEAAASLLPKVQAVFSSEDVPRSSQQRGSDQSVPQDKPRKTAVSSYAAVAAAEPANAARKRPQQAKKTAPKTSRPTDGSPGQVTMPTRAPDDGQGDPRIFIRLQQGNPLREEHPASVRLQVAQLCSLENEDIKTARRVQSGFALTINTDQARQTILSKSTLLCTALNAISVEESQTWASYTILFVPDFLRSGVNGELIDIAELISTEVYRQTKQKPVKCIKGKPAKNYPNASTWTIHLSEKTQKPFRLFDTSSWSRLIKNKPNHIRCTRCMGWHRPDTCHRIPICQTCGHVEHKGMMCHKEEQCPNCLASAPPLHPGCKLAPVWNGSKFTYPTRSMRNRLRTRNRLLNPQEEVSRMAPASTIAPNPRTPNQNRFATLEDVDEEAEADQEMAGMATIPSDNISEADPTDPGTITIPSSPEYRNRSNSGKTNLNRPKTRSHQS